MMEDKQLAKPEAMTLLPPPNHLLDHQQPGSVSKGFNRISSVAPSPAKLASYNLISTIGMKQNEGAETGLVTDQEDEGGLGAEMMHS